MPAFSWKPEYALGIEEMDRQHREVFRLLEELEAAASGEGEREGLQALVAALGRHSACHFGAEESLLDRARYPGIVRQRVQHGRFLQRLHEAEAAAAEGGLSLEEIHGLQSWILGHVVGLDREYLPFLAGDRAAGPVGRV